MNIQSLLVILVVLGILLFAAGAASLLVRKRKQYQNHLPLLIPHLEQLRLDSPFFYQVIKALQQSGEGQGLIVHEDVKSALDLLEAEGLQRSQKKGPINSSFLNLIAGPRSKDKKIRAAMTTVLRAIYFDDKLRTVLPAGMDSELDQYLDHLT